jgi:hypothetical protein
MAKKMKANDIKNIAKKEFAYKKVVVTSNTNQEFTVQIQEKLNDTKISELVISLLERSDYCTKNNIEFNIIQNIYFMLIKYFTDIQFNTYDDLEKTYNHELTTLNALVDLDLFNQIIGYFNQESLIKVQEMFEKYSKQLEPLINNEIKNALKEDEEDAIV